MTIHPVYVGIDVSKAVLDVFDPRTGAARWPNRPPDIDRLVETLGPDAFVVFEATGRYDAGLRAALEARERLFARLNPDHARAFARATGRRAKTDAVDARMLADLGRRLAPDPAAPREEARQDLAEHSRRRDQLVAMRQAERVRLAETGPDALGAGLRRHLDFLDAEIAALDGAIAARIKRDERLGRLARLMRSVPGIGPVAATTLLAAMPELGQRSPKTIASLAGLAPHADESGRRQGRRVIQGGRQRVRRALYMAALAASRTKTRLSAFYKTLREAGKPPKLALLALARKIIVVLNAVVREDQPFRTQ